MNPELLGVASEVLDVHPHPLPAPADVWPTKQIILIDLLQSILLGWKIPTMDPYRELPGSQNGSALG